MLIWRAARWEVEPASTAPVDCASLTFGSTGEEHSLASCSRGGSNVNGDGLLDLVCHFRTQQTVFQIGDSEGILKGMPLDGRSVEASDVVRILR